MHKIKLILSIVIFSVLLSTTSAIKNQTRIIEKSINKIDKKIAVLEKDLYETELDFFYLSSPNNIAKKIKELSLIEYVPMDFSRIYLDYKDFTDGKSKLTTYKNYEKKTKKK